MIVQVYPSPETRPRFVEREFLEFLTCGCLAAGFARFHCDACGHDRLVPFSCKGRGFCPSCGGRRMAQRAVPLVDHVLPDVPVRQWVLSLPYRLRYMLAWDHDLCRKVASVYVRAVLGFLRTRARRAGIANGRSDADGDGWIARRHQRADGTTHLRFEPVALLERLAGASPSVAATGARCGRIRARQYPTNCRCRGWRARSDKGSSVNSLSRHSVNADYPRSGSPSKRNPAASRR